MRGIGPNFGAFPPAGHSCSSSSSSSSPMALSLIKGFDDEDDDDNDAEWPCDWLSLAGLI